MAALIMWIIVSAILTILAWRRGQREKVCLLLLGYWVVMFTLGSISIALPVTDVFLRWSPGPIMMLQWWGMWKLAKRTPKVQEIIRKCEEWKKKRE